MDSPNLECALRFKWPCPVARAQRFVRDLLTTHWPGTEDIASQVT